MKRILSAALLYLFAVVLLTYPSVNHLSNRIIGDGGDNYQFLAFQFLAKREVDNGQLPFGWTNYWRYPVGFDFGNGYDSALFLTLGISFYQFVSDPVVVYNLTVLSLLFLDALLSYCLFYEITGSFLLGFTGGLIYGFSFYNLARMGGHPNLLLTGAFPFLLYSFLLIGKRKGDFLSFAVLTLAVLLIHLSSLQHVLLLLAFSLFALPLLFIFYRDIFTYYLRIFWKKKTSVLMLIVINLAVFLFFNYSKLLATLNGTLVLPGAELVSPPIINFFLPNKYQRLLIGTMGNNTQEWIEYALFLGFPEIILFMLFFFSDVASKKLKLFLAAVFSVNFLLALGDGHLPGLPLPYPFLFSFMPFRGIIESGRFYIFFYLVMVIGLVFYLKKYIYHLGIAGLVLILFLFTFERLPENYYLSSTLKNETFIDYVKNSNTSGVLDLPLYPEWWNGNLYDMYSIYYQKPIVNGYIHWSGLTADAKFFTNKLHRFECDLDPEFEPHPFTADEVASEISQNLKILPDFRGYNIRTFVDHKNLSQHPKECGDAVQRINILFTKSGINFTKVFEDNNKAVYYLES